MIFRLVPGDPGARDVLGGALGKLERAVMDVMWRRSGEASVGDVRAAVGGRLAYTTFMTTLDRLYKKGLLSRRKERRAYLYSPRISREQLDRGVAADVIDGLLGGDPRAARPILSCFVEAVSQRDRRLLDELDRLVRQKRNGREPG
jgi:predicted transcriptional regulator